MAMLYMSMYIFVSTLILSLTEGEDDLQDVKKEVSDLAAHWIHIADSLRIPESIQSKIKRDYPEADLCLRAVLINWLKKRYNFHKFGLPTWRFLVEAIADPAGCNDPAKANEIARNHPGMTIHVVCIKFSLSMHFCLLGW